MKPLYLQGKPGMTVDVEDAALTVTVPTKNPLFFPLSRVSRIVVSGNTHWSMAALFACAQAGAMILFLHDNGEIKCRVIGKHLFSELSLLDLPNHLVLDDAIERYQNWRQGMERMAIRSAARRIRLKNWQQATEKIMLRQGTALMPSNAVRALSLLRSLTLSKVVQNLSELGIDAHGQTLRNERMKLAEDLSSILCWDYFPAIIRKKPAYFSAFTHADWTTFFEARQSRIDFLLGKLLSRLTQSLQEFE